VAFTKVFAIYEHIIFEFTLFIILLYLPSPIPEIASTGLIFSFTYMCAQYLHYIHPPMPFPHLLTRPGVPTAPGKTCSDLLCSDFAKEKNDIFACQR
jgi:hypothetical protein